MLLENKQWVVGYIFAHSAEKYCYSVIKNICKKHDFNISAPEISDIIRMKGLLLTEKKSKKCIPNKSTYICY